MRVSVLAGGALLAAAIVASHSLGSPSLASPRPSHLRAKPIEEALARDGEYVCTDAKGLLVAYGHVLQAPYVFRLSEPHRLDVNGFRFLPRDSLSVAQMAHPSAAPPDTVDTLVRSAFLASGRDSMSVEEFVGLLAQVYRSSGLFDSIEVRQRSLSARRRGSPLTADVVVPWTIHRSDFDARDLFLWDAASVVADCCSSLRAGGVYIFGAEYLLNYPIADRESIRHEIANGPAGARILVNSPLSDSRFRHDLELAQRAE
ncbi:MAG: hypothetical protein U0167_03160 [bacterium]